MTGSTSWLGLLLIVACAAAAPPAGSFGGFQRITTSTGNNNRRHQTSMQGRLGEFRGGAAGAEEYDEDYDSEYDEDEPIVKTTRKLASSTKAVAQKKKKAAIKSKVKVAMASSSSAAAVATKRSAPRVGMYRRYVPYIVRACLNPFTLIAMTKAYFVSLCDINYLKEEQSQTLRSALEDKARKQQPPVGGPPKRKMKPGQAKTLSDLPQLSA